MLQTAALDLLLEAENFGAGLDQVNVDGVHLLHYRQRCSLVGVDQSPHGDAGTADAAGDGGLDGRVFEVDPGVLHGGFGGGDAGLSRLERGYGIVIILLAYSLDGDEFLEAVGPRTGGGDFGFGYRQGGFRLFISGFIGSRIDLVESRSRVDVGSFCEETFLNDSVDLGADFGDQERRCAAGKFCRQHRAFGSDGDDAYFRGLWGRGRGLTGGGRNDYGHDAKSGQTAGPTFKKTVVLLSGREAQRLEVVLTAVLVLHSLTPFAPLREHP